MEIEIKRNIESLIREYADKSDPHYYSLDVESLTKHEQESLVDFLFDKDAAFKELVLDHIQKLINERIDMVYAHDQYERDLTPIHDRETGEVKWIFRGV